MHIGYNMTNPYETKTLNNILSKTCWSFWREKNIRVAWEISYTSVTPNEIYAYAWVIAENGLAEQVLARKIILDNICAVGPHPLRQTFHTHIQSTQ